MAHTSFLGWILYTFSHTILLVSFVNYTKVGFLPKADRSSPGALENRSSEHSFSGGGSGNDEMSVDTLM
jgi:hypothetical protein